MAERIDPEFCDTRAWDEDWIMPPQRTPHWGGPSVGRMLQDIWQYPATEVCVAEPTEGTYQERFRELARRWRAETKTLSSTTDRVLHSAYQDIIGMGERVVPLILSELKENGGHWFWALRHITHENPVPPQDSGKIKKMTEAWIRWGQERRYL